MGISRETNKYLFGVTSKTSNLPAMVVVVVMVARQPSGQHLQMAFGMHWRGVGEGRGSLN